MPRRAVRTQKFLQCTARDMEERRQKYEAAVQACGAAGKVLSKASADAFLERLAQDAVRRDLKRQALSSHACTNIQSRRQLL